MDNEIKRFTDKANISADRMNESIKGIDKDSSRNYSHGGNHILECTFDLLKQVHEHQKNELNWFKSQKLATKLDLKETEKKIMSKISEFADRQTAFNDKMDAAITGVTADVKSLNDQIAALQATSGVITAEDQALLDGIEVRANAIAAKLEALDALTPPVVNPLV